MRGILLGLAAMLLWGLTDVVLKVLLDKQSRWKVLAYSQIFGFLVLMMFGVEWKADSLSLMLMVLAGVFNFGGFVYFYKAIKTVGVSTTSPIVAAWALVTIMLGVAFGDMIGIVQWASIAVILLGLYLITYQDKFKIHVGHVYALLSMVLFGVNMFIIKIPLGVMGAVLVSAGIKLMTGLFSMPKALMDRSIMRGKIWPIFIVGTLESLGFLAYAKGIEYAPISIVAAVSSASPAVTSTIGYLFLKEKLTKKQGMGISVVVAGIVLISL